MADKLVRRWGGGTAVFSLIMWFTLTPFMATISVHNNGRLMWEQQPLLIRTIGHWLLIIAAILVPPMFFERFLTAYWPNSPVLPLILVWTVISVYLWRGRLETGD